MINIRKIYFIDIIELFSINIIFSLLGLNILGIINQINLIMRFGIQSTELHLKILKISLYLSPYLISMIMPFSILISIVMLINKFYKENKIIALQNLSLGPQDIQKPLYLVGIVILLIHYFLYFSVSPGLYKKFKDIKLELSQGSIAALVEPYALKSYGKDIHIYIESKDTNNNLYNIFITDMRDAETIKSFNATQGRITPQGIELINGLYNEISSSGFIFLEFKKYSLNLSQPQKEQISNDPYSMSIAGLLESSYLSNNNQALMVMHQKIIWPIYSLLFIFICFNLEWYFTYKSYSRKSRQTSISIILCIIISICHFLIKNLAITKPNVGLILMYFFPIMIIFFLKRFIKT